MLARILAAVVCCAAAVPARPHHHHHHAPNEEISNLQFLIPLHEPEAAGFSDIPDDAFHLDRELSAAEGGGSLYQPPAHPRFPLALVDSERDRWSAASSPENERDLVQSLNGAWGDLTPHLIRLLDRYEVNVDSGHEPVVQMYYLGGDAGFAASESVDAGPYTASQPAVRPKSKFRPVSSRRTRTVLHEEYPGMLQYYRDQHRKSRSNAHAYPDRSP